MQDFVCVTLEGVQPLVRITHIMQDNGLRNLR